VLVFNNISILNLNI